MATEKKVRHRHNAILIGISGCSSSGKTTLSRVLRDIFPNVFILHEDDFYKTDAEIPINKELNVADWDCLESVDLQALEDALKHIQDHGSPPPHLVSKEDKNSVGHVDIDRQVIEDLSWKASRWMVADLPPIAIIDGFLLYSEAMKNIRELFDLRLFLRTDYKTAKFRRENRSGYVTLEGFWEDPPGYVDNVVWPNYVHDHAFLFEDGNVEGNVKLDLLKELKIDSMPTELQSDMTAVVKWAFQKVDGALEDF